MCSQLVYEYAIQEMLLLCHVPVVFVFFSFLQFNKIYTCVCVATRNGEENFLGCYKQWMLFDVRYTAECVCELVSIDSVCEREKSEKK